MSTLHGRVTICLHESCCSSVMSSARRQAAARSLRYSRIHCKGQEANE